MLKTDQLNANNMLSLDAARERRRYIEIANNSTHWIQTKASFALEGIELTDVHAERAGRLISGNIDLAQCLESLMRECKTPWFNVVQDQAP